MEPNDPRHGTHTGYRAGCSENCCRKAHALYMNLYRMDSKPRMVPAIGTHRRIQALMCLGWSMGELARQMGRHRNRLHNSMAVEKVQAKTHREVAELYERLCMVVPTDPADSRDNSCAQTRLLAQRRGYAPPLAWDNIDDPNEQPARAGHQPRRPSDVNIANEYDPVVVERILAGDYRITASAAERREVVRRWKLSHNELERRTGWKVERYIDRADGAA